MQLLLFKKYQYNQEVSIPETEENILKKSSVYLKSSEMDPEKAQSAFAN